jgi:glycosyltransferase involved in cell wall biosynthesis
MKVSVIITSYNYGKYLGKAIRSVLEQDFPRDFFEILVVDAMSTDNTPEILREYESEIKVILQEDKSGLAGGCNLGIRASSGEFIIRLDADDTFFKNALSVQVEHLEKNSQIGFVYPDYYVLREGIKTRVYLPEFNPEEIFKRGDFLGGGMMYRKSIFDLYGLYNESLRSIENYEFILRILCKGVSGLHVAQPLFVYLHHGASMSDDQATMSYVWNILERQYSRPFGFGKYHPRKLFE